MASDDESAPAKPALPPPPRLRGAAAGKPLASPSGLLGDGPQTRRPADSPAAVFTLVDHPNLRPETLRALLHEWRGEPLAIPRYRGERGHPVLLRRDVVEELLALEPTASPKPAVRGRYPEALFLDLDDPAIVEDIDTPERLEAIRRNR